MPSFWSKVDRRIHVDARVRSLSPVPPCGQGLWWYLLTAPESTPIPGLIAAGPLALAESLGWSPKAFREAFREVFREGLAKADWKARLVWIPNAIRYNFPESPNVILGWARYADLLPECELRTQALRSLRAYFEEDAKKRDAEVSDSKSTDRRDPEAFLKAFRKAFPEAFLEALPEVAHTREARVPAPVSVLYSREDSVLREGEEEGESREDRAPVPPSADPAPVRSTKPRKVKPPPILEVPPLPAVLDTPEIRSAFEARLRERSEQTKAEARQTPEQLGAQIRQLAKVAEVRGVDHVICCLDRATAGHHQGVVFPEDQVPAKGNGNGKNRRPWETGSPGVSDELAAEYNRPIRVDFSGECPE